MVTPARDREAFEQAIARGSELLKQNLLDQAQRAFRAALELDPQNPRVLALLGLSHFRAGQFAEARPIYEDLVELAPTDASYRLNLGLVYLKLNDASHAITSLEASRALDPSQGRAVSYLGLAYARAGRYAEAYRSFLLAGQNELASEIEQNLTPGERDGIHAQLRGRTPSKEIRPPSGELPVPVPVPRTPTPKTPLPPPGFDVVIPRTSTPVDAAVPRTSTPPRGSRSTSAELPAMSRTITPPPDARDSEPFLEPRTVTPPPDAIREIGPRASTEGVAATDPVEIFPRTRPPTAPPGSRIRPPEDRATTSGSIVILADEPPAPIVDAPEPPRMSESMQFVLGLDKQAAPAEPLSGETMISRAVAIAEPSSAATAASGRTPLGSQPPRPLSELATEALIRPEDADHPFEISPDGALIVRVRDRMLCRLAGVHVTGGDLAFKPAMRHSRGHQIEERFDHGGAPLHVVSGTGYLIAVPHEREFAAVVLDDDIFYMREDLVFGFESTLRWENGNVPGLRGRLPVVQFRGDGAVALSLARPLVRVKLPAQGVVFVDAERLAGWIGRVIPRAVVPSHGGPLGEVCIECTGEGVVLVDPGPKDAGIAAVIAEVPRPAPPPPPEPPRPPVEISIDPDSLDEL